MSYSVKRNKGVTAKFKAFSVTGDRNFLDTESGELVNVADVIAKTIGEDIPVDISVTIKQEDDVTPNE